MAKHSVGLLSAAVLHPTRDYTTRTEKKATHRQDGIAIYITASSFSKNLVAFGFGFDKIPPELVLEVRSQTLSILVLAPPFRGTEASLEEVSIVPYLLWCRVLTEH